MSGWINVEDRLPPIGKDILVFHVNGYCDIDGCTNYDLAVLRGEEYSQTAGQFTHWMPLPESPKNYVNVGTVGHIDHG